MVDTPFEFWICSGPPLVAWNTQEKPELLVQCKKIIYSALTWHVSLLAMGSWAHICPAVKPSSKILCVPICCKIAVHDSTEIGVIFIFKNVPGSSASAKRSVYHPRNSNMSIPLTANWSGSPPSLIQLCLWIDIGQIRVQAGWSTIDGEWNSLGQPYQCNIIAFLTRTILRMTGYPLLKKNWSVFKVI